MPSGTLVFRFASHAEFLVVIVTPSLRRRWDGHATVEPPPPHPSEKIRRGGEGLQCVGDAGIWKLKYSDRRIEFFARKENIATFVCNIIFVFSLF